MAGTGGEGAGDGVAALFPFHAFIPCREQPGDFPEWSRGAVPHWLLPAGGCVALKERGGEGRAAAPGAAAPSGLGARGSVALRCPVPRIAQGRLGPHSLEGAEAFLPGFSVGLQGAGCCAKGNLGFGACLAA